MSGYMRGYTTDECMETNERVHECMRAVKRELRLHGIMSKIKDGRLLATDHDDVVVDMTDWELGRVLTWLGY